LAGIWFSTRQDGATQGLARSTADEASIKFGERHEPSIEESVAQDARWGACRVNGHGIRSVRVGKARECRDDHRAGRFEFAPPEGGLASCTVTIRSSFLSVLATPRVLRRR
jgi:hypothetical protein